MTKKRKVTPVIEVPVEVKNEATEILIKEAIKDKRKAQAEVKKKDKEVKVTKFITPFHSAQMIIEYELDGDKKLKLSLGSEINNGVENTFKDLYIELLKSLNAIATMTATIEDE